MSFQNYLQKVKESSSWENSKKYFKLSAQNSEKKETNVTFRKEMKYLFKGFNNETKEPNNGFENSIRSLLVENILETMVFDQINENFEQSLFESLEFFPQLDKLKENGETAILKGRKNLDQCWALPFMLKKNYFKDAFILHEEETDKTSFYKECLVTMLKNPEDYSNEAFEKINNLSKNNELKNTDSRNELDKGWANFRNIFKLQPLQDIRDYFGEYVALYFSFAGILISSLWIPSLLGILFFIIGIVLT